MNRHSNDTILKMINYMKPSVNKMVDDTIADEAEETALEDFSFINKTPLKRTASKLSLDGGSPTTPVKKIKEDIKKPDWDYIGSPREVRRLRADLLETRNTISNLESRINHMHGIRKEMQVLFDNECRSLKKQTEHDRKSILELENQLQTIRKREQELKLELVEFKNKSSVLKISYDQKIEALEKKLSDISSEQKAHHGQENSEIANLQRQILELQNALQIAKEDSEVHQKLTEKLENQLLEKNSAITELEMKNNEIQKLKLQMKEYDYIKENYLEFQEQAKTQSTKLAQFVQIEKENVQLRAENFRIKDEIKNKLLLEEEVHDLKKRLQKFKEQEAKFANVQMQLVQTEMYLNEWKAVARGILEETNVNDTALPHLLRSAVERLQQQELTLTDEKVNLQSQLNTALHDSKVAKEELSKIQKLLTKLNGTDEQKKNLIHRMQKKLLLVSRERDSYRLQLDSYEKDLTMCVNTSSLGSQAANQVQSLKERVENLEKIVTGYRDMVAKLEADLQNTEHDNSDLPPIRLEQITRLQNEVDKFKQENERLRERKDQLEIQLEEYLVGNDTLRGGRVYHLSSNPLSECLAQRDAHMQKLQEEVDRLKRKVKNMEEGMESSKLVDISMSTKEVQMLKEEISNHELQTQRLKDYFKSSMLEFRDAVYMLFGYKVDKSSKSLYKLTSIYAENAEDILCFQFNNSGHLNLLETEYSSRLENLIELHLRHQDSIPNFLSSLTLDLYSNRTMITEQL
ncbi:hypothetical protein WA026_022384 [Henosepilachna vigintioctopunctata]|uniref:Mitotic spindle assembly checkpoint protein MAD1 n=1 Tax=Henosepilachna vigintioctopunctata TaxID=420089 RepID=A0AAW1UGQ2_9CUCU